jgi:sensor histidine kinase YesM
LNPHFLFNALTSIQDHILNQDAKAGNDMIVRLSRVFRKVLDTGKFEDESIPMIHLSDEIALVEDIVHLNNKQLTVPVSYALTIDSVIREADPLIPPMLIQPFVENAFKHAFHEQDEDKSVAVHITADQGYLSISITDNGIGYDGSSLIPEKTSMGIQLARERMSILNALHIANSIEVSQISPHGTLIEIRIRQMV